MHTKRSVFIVDSKEHILTISLFLFLQKGFKEVTLKDIVDKTGMSKGAFYHYFNSKEQVFAEVINHFFADPFHIDFDSYPQTSLHEFYQHVLDQAKLFNKKLAGMVKNYPSTDINGNSYYVLFDAMRILPGFRTQQQQQQKKEFAAWKKVISIAKSTAEIKTDMPDDIIAKLFINLGDGTNLNLIVDNEMGKKPNELKTLWDSLYNTFKA